jgi:Na+/phosphate symporter
MKVIKSASFWVELSVTVMLFFIGVGSILFMDRWRIPVIGLFCGIAFFINGLTMLSSLIRTLKKIDKRFMP